MSVRRPLFSCSDSYTDTPFVDKIDLMEIPRKFYIPNIRMYDVTSDPNNHVAQYKQQMLTVVIQKELWEATMCKGFSSTLTGPALQWYINLPTRSIRSYATLSDKFVEQFASSRSLEKSSDDLYEILQHRAEPLHTYIVCFNPENVAIPECNAATTISAFKKERGESRKVKRQAAKYCIFQGKLYIRISFSVGMFVRIPLFSCSDSYTDTPFVDEIDLMEIPRKLYIPNIRMYDVTSDPNNHVTQYKQQMLTVVIQKELREATMCKGFSSTLTGPALQWYINLPTRSIRSYATLSDKFVEQFASSRSLEKSSDDLYEILQHRAEPLHTYIVCFNPENVAIPKCNAATTISAFKKDRGESRKVKRQAAKYCIFQGKLYRRISFSVGMFVRIPLFSCSDSYTDTPFVDEIDLMEIPRKFYIPNIRMYDVTSDPNNHVAQYKLQMLTVVIQKELREATICKGFSSTLTGPALQWYINLPTRSIRSYATLSDKFVEQFASSRSLEKSSDDLYEILQHRAEPLHTYIVCFNPENVAIPECNAATTISAFKKGRNHTLNPGEDRFPCGRPGSSGILEMMEPGTLMISEEEDL
ncbi:hypothetical protein Bca4012_006075 [Brassica carinata]